MSNPKPTESEANELVKIRKVISAKLVWKREPKSWRLKAKAVATGQDYVFEVIAYIGKTNYSFTLLYHNCVLRKFTKHSPHKVGGVLYNDPHKHIWDGETENAKAYVPDDINPSDDINTQFLDFCKECNISLVGVYQNVAYQIQ
jgi:hypothetical protein